MTGTRPTPPPPPPSAPALSPPPPLLSVRDLAVSFAPRAGQSTTRTQAVSGVSMTLYPAQTLAVVGESGCGKSVTALSLMHLLPRPPARFDRGAAAFRSSNDAAPIDLLALPEREIRTIRGGQIAMIFQEPMTSLNPVLSIGDQIIEAIRLHRTASPRQARDIAIESLQTVGISDAARRRSAFPHQFSGGMRQRVMIAMALACQPRLLLADEPTTALDATIQQQILDLLRDLQASTGMAVMLITHDLGIVRDRADVVCVMYAGRVVEYARADELLRNPIHPYTRALLSCAPSLESRNRRLTTIAELSQDSEFLRFPASLSHASTATPTPWWPIPSAQTPIPYALTSITPQHWVAVSSPPTISHSNTPPDLAPLPMHTA